MPTWIIAITVIVVLQTTSAYLGRLVPIAAPEFMREFGWDEGWVGYLSAANVIGALFILTAGIGIIKRMGGVLALQLGLVIGAASLLLYLVPSLAVALIASMIIGLNNGAANPAGSEVLQRFTPPAHRNFVFSIKQAGVPLGGVIAGLTIPPLVNSLGWRMALVVAAVGSIAAVALMLPFRARIDPPREQRMGARFVSFRLSDIVLPLRSLSRAPTLWRISWVGCLLAIAQACWVTFAVTYLVVVLGLSLSVAGLVFAVMQATSVIGRMALGWIADHVGVQHHDARHRVGRLGAVDHRVRVGRTGLAGLDLRAARRHRRLLGVRLERRADRRGGASFTARADRRDRRGRGHPGVHEQHAGAGRVRRLRRADRPVRSRVPGRGSVQPCLPATALRHRPGAGKIRFLTGARSNSRIEPSMA